MLLRFLLTISLLCYAIVSYATDTILVVGDSLSASYGIEQQQGWVNLLNQRLQAYKYPYQVENASISGEMSSGGTSRLPALLAEQQPAIVILELGANDGLRGLPVSIAMDNLQTMISAIQDNHAQVVLVGMQLPPNYGPQYTSDFAAMYPSLAQENNIALVPFLLDGVWDNPDWIQDDGLHPRAEGQMQMLDNVWPVLMPLLDE